MVLWFTIMAQLQQKILLATKVFINNSKIVILFCFVWNPDISDVSETLIYSAVIHTVFFYDLGKLNLVWSFSLTDVYL